MIKVTIYRTAVGIQSFEMTGHANYAKHGQDIVCAGASAVVFGSINAIDALCDVQADINLGKNGGFLTYTLPKHLDNEMGKNVQLLLEGMIVSLKTIEMDYGKYIRIQEIMQGV
jgi:hypothetical protein